MTNNSSITERAYKQLKSDFITCRIPPGERITISKVQKNLGLSQAAVREALARLSSEGLVDSNHNSGFRATAISSSGFRELAEACMILEEPCLRSAIEHGDLEWEGKLVASYHISSKLLPETIQGNVDLDQYLSNRQQFYDALFAPCHNRWLLQSWRNLYLQQMRYRHRFYKLAKFEAEQTHHYQAFIKTVCDRQADKAVQLCFEQYRLIIHFMEQLETPEPSLN